MEWKEGDSDYYHYSMTLCAGPGQGASPGDGHFDDHFLFFSLCNSLCFSVLCKVLVIGS